MFVQIVVSSLEKFHQFSIILQEAPRESLFVFGKGWNNENQNDMADPDWEHQAKT
jgi:hypothetical protein